ncbi:MAG: glycerol-3-phosphate 1-O-acyltransferase PlsY [Eubacteriales bacterium]|nr:glycerol-3-phosphate 1-O-acyltransferase PlsY [Eubacteriales bacterium]
MISCRLICLAIGYVFGLFQTSYLLGKLHGIDIRDYGSGNAGTTNMLRTMGTKAGVITFLGDAIKCILAVIVVRLLFGRMHGDILPLLSMYGGAGVILGHNYPFYLGFRGGKGIAATGGFAVAFHPMTGLLAILIFFTTFFLTHYVSLGSLLIYIGFVAELVVMGQLGWFHMSQGALIELYILAFLLAALAFWKHRGNIERLLSGTERKTYLTKKSDQ